MSKKYDGGKPRMDLIRPEFLLDLGAALEYGASKYEESEIETPNYLKDGGMPYSKLIGAMERHTQYFKMKIDIDEESGLYHIVQVAVNAMMLHSYLISGSGIDNRMSLRNLNEAKEDSSERSQVGKRTKVKKQNKIFRETSKKTRTRKESV